MADYNGTNGDDTFSGGSGPDYIVGNGGNDHLSGGGDNDYLEGDDGDDVLNGDSGDDDLDGGTGNDMLDGGDGSDFIIAGSGDDHLVGGSGDDSLIGEDGNDSLLAGDGNDFLRGGAGIDFFDGGNNDSTPIAYMGSYGDTLSFRENKATQGVIADLRTGQIANDGFGNAELMTGIESFGGGTAFADQFYGNDGINRFDGALGDTLMGFGGDDYVIVRAAPALADGGAGVDRLVLALSGSLVANPNGSAVAVSQPTMTQGYAVDLAAGTIVDGNGQSGTVAGIEQIVATSLADT